MDIKQFNLFQETIQYAIDEDKRARETGVRSHFDMGSWMIFGYNAQERGISLKRVTNVPELGHYATVEGLEMGSCGTAACLAGTAVLMHGADKFLVDVDDIEDTNGAAYVLTEDNERVSIPARAERLLGMKHDEAHELFHMTAHSMSQIVDYASGIAKRHGHQLEVMW
jgi:hypothetical protein